MDGTVLDLLANYRTGRVSLRAFAAWANDQMLAAKDSKSLVLLAGLLPGEDADAEKLFIQALTELGAPVPAESAIELQKAKLIAKDILEGKIQPNEGCELIRDISIDLDYPEELSGFHLLAHEQTGHEDLGITAESLIPEILQAAHDLWKK